MIPDAKKEVVDYEYGQVPNGYTSARRYPIQHWNRWNGTLEGHEESSPFDVIPQFHASGSIPLDSLPNSNPLLLGRAREASSWRAVSQYIKAPIPTSGELGGYNARAFRIREVLDKGKAAAVTSIVETRDKHFGKLTFKNQSTVFIRGAGGFGGKRTGRDRGPASAASFAGVVDPGETLVTEMWKEGSKVIFVVKVKERNAVVLASAAVTIGGESRAVASIMFIRRVDQVRALTPVASLLEVAKLARAHTTSQHYGMRWSARAPIDSLVPPLGLRISERMSNRVLNTITPGPESAGGDPTATYLGQTYRWRDVVQAVTTKL
ncbi:hypothetical protein AAF712_003942 [Marasmius tenuissimus]|uniref:Peroxisomal multifunctional enzyme type 2-like N-terminal domain-containing protein n=1 Tax=Marasmius tenuissimus TaxID=585030 RepID=A0ABR3A7J1_9AGAR